MQVKPIFFTSCSRRIYTTIMLLEWQCIIYNTVLSAFETTALLRKDFIVIWFYAQGITQQRVYNIILCDVFFLFITISPSLVR